MNWLVKTAGPEEYLATLGAPPETIQWIMSQPNSQFFINEFRKNPGVDVTSLQPPQKSEPTNRELQRVNIFAVSEQAMKNWALIQLRKFRHSPNPLSTGEMDYNYLISMTEFDNKLRQMSDWYRMASWDLGEGNYLDISSYTWDQAWAESVRWHNQQESGEGLYGELDSSLTMFKPPEWNGWFIQNVVSEQDLKAEGDESKMDHCVKNHSYIRAVAAGSVEIYSLRDPKNEPHVTIEMEPDGSIRQIMGKANSEPKDEYKKLIKQWFDQFKKERPGLAILGDDFDFDELRYVENQYLDEEINRVVYKENENDYGLKVSLSHIDISDIYAPVVGALITWRGHDTRYVRDIGTTIAMIAWESDKERARNFGLIPGSETEEHGKHSFDERMKKFKFESSRYGVGDLRETIEKNDEKLWDSIMDCSLEHPGDFATEAEYQTAVDEEHSAAESETRSQNLPYALDDVIRDVLEELAIEDPFLPEHPRFNSVASNENWLQKIAQVIPPWTQTWEEFIAHHQTGNISGGYGDEGQGLDLSHYNDRNQKNGWYSPERYPVLIGKRTFNVPRYGEVEVEFRQTGDSNKYVKTSEPDETGYSDIVRDEKGNAIYYSPDEMREKDLPAEDTTTMMFSNGLCIGHIGDSFGATELFVVREFQGGGIGPYALKLYMETYPSKGHKTPRLGQMTWQGIATAKKSWMMFVEDAIKSNKPVPQEVIASYEEENQHRMNNPPQRTEYDIPKYKTTKVEFGSGSISPMKGFNTDLLHQMGVNFWDVKYGPGDRPDSYYMDEGGDWEDAIRFVENLGYQAEGYQTYNLKMDYSGEHGIILPANA
jgi:hypothetical protein